MDLLPVALIPNNAIAPQALSADGSPLDSGIVGGEFAVLLALGLNPPQPCCEPKTPELESADKENATESQLLAPPLELLAASPQTTSQAPVSTDSTAAAFSSTNSADKSDLPVAPASVQISDQHGMGTLAEAHGTPENVPAADTRIADRAANVAAGAEKLGSPTLNDVLPQDLAQHATAQVESRLQVASQPRLASQLAVEVQRSRTPESAQQLAASAHALHFPHPIETRAPLSQPSALLEVAAPVSEPGFADALSRQVVWMVDKDAQVAELRINPPELGPVEVRLTIAGDEAQAQFSSAHAEVREAIENALVRLRETLAQAGIQLGETSVSAESFADQAQRESSAARQGYGGDRLHNNALQQDAAAPTRMRHGLVDVFA